ncbi:hypothetical protein ACIGXM_26295 [Kitasatospora sp. NPDC052896]|uniref:hypothetical protein n=1 Tax=Kitasatospora sp. NPDC052896 TaxID=3364061 RepID=UPI0037C565E4
MADAVADRTPAQAPAHTRTRARHWIAVAAAVSAVTGGALAASPAVGVTTTAAPGTPRPVPTAEAPDPAKAQLPLDCGPLPVRTSISVPTDLGDGVPSTLVAAHCDTAGGTAPDGVFLLTPGPGGPPRIQQTLVRWQEGFTVTRLALRGDGSITATAEGYSTPDVPRCCPDLTVTLNWTRRGGSYVRTQSSAPSATA